MENRFSKRLAFSLVGLVVMIGLLVIAVIAEENTYSIETDTAKLSFAGTRMLDPSVPSDDYAGNDYVLVIFNYENYTTDPKSPQRDFWPTVYQNGVELDTLRSRKVNDTEDYKILDGFNKTVIKGGVLEFGEAYEIQDDSPLTVVLKQNGASTVDPVSFEVNIGEEAAAVEEDSGEKKDSLVTSETTTAEENTYSIETDTAKLSFAGTRMLDPSVPSDDYAGNDYVLVIFNYENYTTDPKSPQRDFWPTVYQNGVELDTLRSRKVNDTEDYKILDGFNKTVIKGGVLEFGEAYEIQDDSPLTVVLKQNGASTVDPVSFEVNIGEEASITESPATEEGSNSIEVTAETTKTVVLTPNFVFHTDASTTSEESAKYETLTVGSSGDAVAKLQEALIEKQLLEGTADGKYGNMTAGAVSAFQESAGIVATGEADSVTQEILYGEYVEPEIDVAQALQEGTWLFNGGDDLILNGISFSDTNATLAQVYFDGNGKHENESQALPYVINEDSITLTLVDGSTMEVPFEVKNGKLCLNNGEWVTVSDVKGGLQGNWTDSFNEFGVSFEFHTTISGDLFTSENANSNGFYFGPYEGTYELNFGGFDADFMHSNDWFYNIIDGEVKLLRYDRVYEKTDVGLLGQGGYSF